VVARPAPLPDPVGVSIWCGRCEEQLWRGSVGGPGRGQALALALKTVADDHQRLAPACRGATARALQVPLPGDRVGPT